MMCLQLPKQCVWELELKDQSGGGWRTIHPAPGSLSVTPDCLTPGTKYIFRARAGVPSSDDLLLLSAPPKLQMTCQACRPCCEACTPLSPMLHPRSISCRRPLLHAAARCSPLHAA